MGRIQPLRRLWFFHQQREDVSVPEVIESKTPELDHLRLCEWKVAQCRADHNRARRKTGVGNDYELLEAAVDQLALAQEQYRRVTAES